ncbi:acyltransferase family protein, partial [Thermomonas sp.]|uniref:acyltransferase family protein n=1 Tax=Thermomonas sp. TaxID=1971895 RepID=UPI00261EBF35
MAELSYRRHIDGLRAVAVLAVVAFHAGVPWLPGGYVGVDVFFVVSGFLITGLLLREFETRGDISLVGFYERRVRRLAPALLLVLAVTLALGAVYLVPIGGE